jgi:hypothetical protein
MDFFKDRRVVAFAGFGVALLVGLIVAFLLIPRDPDPIEPPLPTTQGGLVVVTGRDDDIKLDEHRPLHCFVNGQLVGDLTVADCAHRNGVPPGALDVGLDRTGALAGANGVSAAITPLPPDMASADAPIDEYARADDSAVATSSAKTAACWRYGEAQWTRLPDDETLNDCVQVLYGGQCARTPSPVYGRWSERTLRLVDGRVEISSDNRGFRALAAHAPDCPAVPKG